MPAIISPGSAIEQAMATAGSDDFGPEGWREGLERSLGAFGRMPLTAEARDAAVAKCIADLTRRLRIEQWFKAHPEILEQPVEGPVFVMGLPRTGTTATVAMLALDDRFRFLRGWEGAEPLPPPVAGAEHADPRVVAARAAAAGYAKANIHLFDPDGPEEDLAMLAGLHMHSYHGTIPMPDDYLDWWLHQDFTSFYAYHARILQLLQSRRPPHLWLLKSPPHLLRLKEIARQYPQARFVMTHRDPVKIIASVASLHAKLHAERCLPGTLDRARLGAQQLALWSHAMRRFLAERAQIGEHRFIDVRNDEVVRQPAETFERIYQHLGMPIPAGLIDRLREYNSRNAPGQFGEHRYTAEEYGLSDAVIREAFQDYTARFGPWDRAG